jgi:hypothetical protein
MRRSADSLSRVPTLNWCLLAWIKRGRYWVAYDPAGPVIAGVFFETDDIPTRARG